ncbi:MAG: amidohydrolase [Gemmataceae bacterium]|nr:amidohydrolase [Gemmataceae bacterium]
MRFLLLMVLAVCAGMNQSAATAQEFPSPKLVHLLKDKIDSDYERLDKLYKHLHAHPELALQEEKTAARLAQELRAAGLEVTEKVGGFGVVGLIQNGDGPVVMIRADMDGLPIIENTGLAYASTTRVRNEQGREVGVMHACGHDVNMTSLVGTARLLCGMKDQWRGTLLFIGQPAEETGAGARLMLQDGLFRRFPKPHFAFALHCDGRFPHGTVNFRSGQMQANVDSMDILVRGKGGHGAAPHTTIDPVVLAARIILDLQTLTSRERDPTDAAVVTVGSIQGGTKHNIIPDEVHLQLTIRTTNDKTRKEVLEGIVRIAKAAAQGARAADPIIKHDAGSYTPALVNEPELTQKTVALFRKTLGADKVIERPMSMGGEDFSQFVRAGVTGFYFHLGCVTPERFEESKKGGKPLPPTHSDGFYPVPEPTIKTGVLAMSLAVLDVLDHK